MRVEVFRNGRSRRDCCLYSIDAQFPKLDVAGSIPVSRSLEISRLEVAHQKSAAVLPHLVHERRFQSLNGFEPALDRRLGVNVQVDADIVPHSVSHDLRIDTKFSH